MNKYIVFAVIGIFALTGCNGSADFYGKAVDQGWQKIFRIEESKDGEFRWFGYPVDNFGLLTAYDAPQERAWTPSDQVCATWKCLDIVDSTKIPSDPDRRLKINDFADVGLGGAVTISETSARTLGINLLLPSIADFLKITTKVDWSKGVKAEIKFGNAYLRRADRNKYQEFIENKSQNNLLKITFKNGRLAWIAADIVAQGMEITVTVDTKANADAELALNEAVSVIAKNAKLGIKGESKRGGTYHFTVNHPVILAVQTRRQPGAGTLTTSPRSVGDVISRPVPRPTIDML
jgi:hypothetical protein